MESPIKNRHLVFISAGDLAEKVLLGLAGGAYDVAICYFGANPERAEQYEAIATPGLFWQRRGSKLQNFQATFWAGAGAGADAERYDTVALLDDDIALSPTDIETLFRIHEDYKLDVSQPAFLPAGKISHDVTKVRPENRLRFVNFVEITAMFLSRAALATCMAAYDARLVGFGIDYLFLWTLGPTRTDAYAIVDAVACFNPTEATKYAAAGQPIGPREIDQLERLEQRRNTWLAVAKEKGIPLRWDHRVFAAVKQESTSTSSPPARRPSR